MKKFYLKIERAEKIDGYFFTKYEKENGETKIVNSCFVPTKSFLNEGKSLVNLNSICGLFEIEN